MITKHDPGSQQYEVGLCWFDFNNDYMSSSNQWQVLRADRQELSMCVCERERKREMLTERSKRERGVFCIPDLYLVSKICWRIVLTYSKLSKQQMS